MALRFFDGFDTKTPNVGYGKWINSLGIGSNSFRTPGRSGQGFSAQFQYRGTSSDNYFSYVTDTPQNEWILGFAAYFPQPTGSIETTMIKFMTGSQSELDIKLYWPHIRVYRGDNTLLAELMNICLPIRWMYIEIAVKIDNSSGYVIIRADSSTKLQLTNQDTAVSASPSVNTINFGAIGITPTGDGWWWADDFYLLDKTGNEFNDFLGDVVVYTLIPNADGSTNDWTPNSGTTRYTQVDEIPHDSDTTYIYTTVDGAKQYFDFPDQVNITILAVQNTAVVRKDDSTTRYIKMCAKLGANEVVTNSWVLSNSYLHFTQVLPRDPANNQWSLQNFNSTQFGLIHSLTP